MSADSITANIARVARLAYKVDAFEADEGSLDGVADLLRKLAGELRRDVDEELARLRAEVERLTRERDAEKELRLGTEAVRDFANSKLLEAIERAETAERERKELLAWAAEMGCEMQADDLEGYTPEECSPDHSGRCWPCEAKVRAELAKTEVWRKLVSAAAVEIPANVVARAVSEYLPALVDELDRYTFDDAAKRVRAKPGAEQALVAWADRWLDVFEDGEQP